MGKPVGKPQKHTRTLDIQVTHELMALAKRNGLHIRKIKVAVGSPNDPKHIFSQCETSQDGKVWTQKSAMWQPKSRSDLLDVAKRHAAHHNILVP